MRTRWVVLITALAVSALLSGCAVSDADVERRAALDAEIAAVLATPQDEPGVGEIKRCLSDWDYRRYSVLDERRMLFEDRDGTRWLNTLPTRCPGLRLGHALRVRQTHSFGRICRLDQFAVDDLFSWPWYRRWPWHWNLMWGSGMTCTFGDFRHVSEGQVNGIRELIERDRKGGS